MSKAIVFKTKSNEKIYPCPYFPIGYIYLSATNIDPGSIFGGTWERIKDKFLLTAGDSYSAGNTGGNTSHSHTTSGHALTVSEMPSHTHYTVGRTSDGHINPVVVVNSGGSTGGATFPSTYGWTNYGSGGYAYVGYNGSGNSHSHGNTGSSSHMPPYLVVYAWKRVS